jgi:AcrR family transcriptional regulator
MANRPATRSAQPTAGQGSSTAAKVRVRDPEGTREKILAAGLKEFAAKGFAGARIDAIAQRAGVNKRMLYHYFGPKEKLYYEIMRRKVEEKNARSVQGSPHDLVEALPYWFELASGDLEWIRMLQWEALRVGARKLVCEDERREGYITISSRLRGEQATGGFSEDLAPTEVLLATLALSIYPVAFPQMVRLVTGLKPTDAAFKASWCKFLMRVGEFLMQVEDRPLQRSGRNGRLAVTAVSQRPSRSAPNALLK